MNRMTENNYLIAELRSASKGCFHCFPKTTGRILTCLVLIILLSGMLLHGMGALGHADESEIMRLGFGTLTSVEADRTVIIDERGYSVDSYAKVVNSDGRRVRLKELTLPADVKFEYISGPKGPIIKSLRMLGK